MQNKTKSGKQADLNLAPKAANIPTLPTAISLHDITEILRSTKQILLPDPPTFAIVIGADCNYGCDSRNTRQNTKSGFIGPSGRVDGKK